MGRVRAAHAHRAACLGHAAPRAAQPPARAPGGGVAIVRYRLFDIDPIIDKALAHLDNQVEGLPLVGKSKLA